MTLTPCVSRLTNDINPLCFQTPSGRPKRVAAMSSRERQRAKKRTKRTLDSDESGTE